MQTVAAISIRGLNDDQFDALKQQARQKGISLNRLVLNQLTGAPSDAGSGQKHQDHDALAGTWSRAEKDAFEAAIAPLEQVGPELWS
jgi:hypothetical protein